MENTMSNYKHDLMYLRLAHKAGKQMGMSDEEIIAISETVGGIDPQAWADYVENPNEQ